MGRYTATMKHDAGTIGRLVEMQRRTFQFGRRATHLFLSAALILYGLLADKSMITSYLALMVGCVMVTGLNAGVRRQTRRILQEMNGEFPQSRYTFSEKGFRFYDKGEDISYQKLICLVEDREYLYLYISKQSAYMVDRSSISGGSPAALKAFLSEKSGLDWTRPNSLLTFRLPTLWKRAKDEDTGPRLR